MSKTTIYIHVGMHKTGTTSIQATLFKNRRSLLRHDINYLAVSENHGTLLYPLLSGQPRRRNEIDTEDKLARHSAGAEKAVRRALARNRSSRLVVSGEGLFRLNADGVSRLKELFAPYGADIRIIVYFREPYGFISSAFQQRLRAGHEWDKLIANLPLPRYRRIQPFIDVFGRDCVDMRIFEPSRLRDCDLLADFFAAIDSDTSLARRIKTVNANQSLSHEAVLILKALNRLYPISTDGQPHPERAWAINETLAMIKGRPFRVPQCHISAVRADIEDDLEWLHRLLAQRVFPSGQDYTGEPEPAPEWSQDAVDSIAILVNALAKKNVSIPARLLRGWEVMRTFALAKLAQ